MSETEPQPRNIIEIATPEGLTASINKTGAYLERLVAPNGSDLIFPRHTISSKRGGIPVCAPVFGPGDKAGLAQHGFARDLEWEKTHDAAGAASFRLQNPTAQNAELAPENYAGCQLDLSFMMRTYGSVSVLEMVLKASNEGSKPFIFTPGFHPYFPSDKHGNDTIKIQQNETVHEFSLSEIAVAKVLPASSENQLTFTSGEHRVVITSGKLSQPVVWTDKPEAYFCVEPTYKGAATAPDSTAKADLYVLEPGLTQEHFMEIEWAPLH